MEARSVPITKSVYALAKVAITYHCSHYRMLIQYGLMRGLIRHLQRYPVLVTPAAEAEAEADELEQEQESEPLSPEVQQLHDQW